MARAFWKGHLSFGLVEIPVRLQPAERRSEELHFTLLDREDFTPVGYRRYNKGTGEDVPWHRIVKGYEHAPGEYVVLSPQDFERANVEATRAIELLEFVDGAEIDPVHYEEPYHVVPERKSSKSYALLRETLSRTGKVGIAQVVLRTRQHRAALRVRDDALVLVLLRDAAELVPTGELEVPGRDLAKLGVSAKELAIATKLVEGMAAPWRPEKYRDTYQDDLRALIEKRIASGQTHEVEAAEPLPRRRTREVVDLMPLLQRSLERAGTRNGGARSRAGDGPAAARGTRASRSRGRARAAKPRGATRATPSRRPAKRAARRATAPRRRSA